MPEKMLGVDITVVDATAQHELGTEYLDGRTGKKYRYVKATAAVTKSNALQYDSGNADEPNAVKHTDAAAQAFAGWVPDNLASNPASGNFFWMLIRGKLVDGNVATGVAANDVLGSTSTAGRVAKLDSAGANPTQAEHRAALGALVGCRAIAMDAEASNKAELMIHS